MSDKGTPYATDSINIQNGTEPDEIREFVKNRAKNPIEVDGLRVWNFNNHEVDVEALEGMGSRFMFDEYMIPYQVPGPWAYMVSLLPRRIKEAEILIYSKKYERYNPYPNFLRQSETEDDEELLDDIDEWIQQEL